MDLDCRSRRDAFRPAGGPPMPSAPYVKIV
jgi:hypothetical protein